MAPIDSFHESSKCSGVLCSTLPSVRTKVRSWIVDQPVHWASSMMSTLLPTRLNSDRLTMGGISTLDVTPVSYSTVEFTPAASAATVAASAGGTVGTGFAKLALPLMSYLMLER